MSAPADDVSAPRPEGSEGARRAVVVPTVGAL